MTIASRQQARARRSLNYIRVACQSPLERHIWTVSPSTKSRYLPSGREFATHRMEYRQFLYSRVPDKATLTADTVQNDLNPLPFKTPDILTGSRVHAIIFPF
jgi:hypothetical protein